MTTGSFTDWAGTIAEIGVIYPFEGTEVLLVIAGLIFWVAWHISQLKSENAQLKKEEDQFKS